MQCLHISDLRSGDFSWCQSEEDFYRFATADPGPRPCRQSYKGIADKKHPTSSLHTDLQAADYYQKAACAMPSFTQSRVSRVGVAKLFSYSDGLPEEEEEPENPEWQPKRCQLESAESRAEKVNVLWQQHGLGADDESAAKCSVTF